MRSTSQLPGDSAVQPLGRFSKMKLLFLMDAVITREIMEGIRGLPITILGLHHGPCTHY